MLYLYFRKLPIKEFHYQKLLEELGMNKDEVFKIFGGFYILCINILFKNNFIAL